MKTTIRKVIYVCTSIASTVTSNSALAQNIQSNSTLRSVPKNESAGSMIDQFIDHDIFSVDKIDGHITINNARLIQTLKSGLENKILNPSTLDEHKEIYRHLLENLSPGSFKNELENRELTTMDFNKA